MQIVQMGITPRVFEPVRIHPSLFHEWKETTMDFRASGGARYAHSLQANVVRSNDTNRSNENTYNCDQELRESVASRVLTQRMLGNVMKPAFADIWFHAESRAAKLGRCVVAIQIRPA